MPHTACHLARDVICLIQHHNWAGSSLIIGSSQPEKFPHCLESLETAWKCPTLGAGKIIIAFFSISDVWGCALHCASVSCRKSDYCVHSANCVQSECVVFNWYNKFVCDINLTNLVHGEALLNRFFLMGFEYVWLVGFKVQLSVRCESL